MSPTLMSIQILVLCMKFCAAQLLLRAGLMYCYVYMYQILIHMRIMCLTLSTCTSCASHEAHAHHVPHTKHMRIMCLTLST